MSNKQIDSQSFALSAKLVKDIGFILPDDCIATTIINGGRDHKRTTLDCLSRKSCVAECELRRVNHPLLLSGIINSRKK